MPRLVAASGARQLGQHRGGPRAGVLAGHPARRLRLITKASTWATAANSCGGISWPTSQEP